MREIMKKNYNFNYWAANTEDFYIGVKNCKS